MNAMTKGASCENVENILKVYGSDIIKTPYGSRDRFFTEYPLYYLGITHLIQINNRKYLQEFPAVKKAMREADILKKERGLEDKYEDLQKCKSKIKKFKEMHGKINLDFEDITNEYKDLIKNKKNIIAIIKRSEDIIFKYINKKYKIDISQELRCIRVRDIALCNTAENIVEILPKLKDTSIARTKIPVFSYNLKDFVNKLKDKNSAVEGGPCIIGVDEAFFCLVYENGKKRYFDIMTGFEDGPKNIYLPKRYDLADIISRDKRNIVDVEIYEKNRGPTLYNAIELYRLMLIAKKLELPIIIGLPDEAYKKTFSNIIDPLVRPDDLSKKICILLDRVVDEFLKLIFSINKELRLERLEVLHSRNDELMEVFYKKRLKVASSAGNITDIRFKKEAIIDYVCMPATPNFIWGATNILEVNNVMEIESLKSSIEFFPNINFSALIFPYLPDTHNYSSMYHGRSENKVFLQGQYDTKVISSRLNCLGENIITQVPWL